MNKQVSPRLVVCLILGCLSPLAARESDNNRNLSSTVASKPAGEVSDKPPILSEKDLDRLERKAATRQKVLPDDDGKFRSRKSSIMRRMASATQGQRYEVDANSMQNGLSHVACLYRETVRR
jgi:hypothetical protein